MRRVLVDTSVWVEHFRGINPTLSLLLTQRRVYTHPLVVGELACGSLPEPRERTLLLLDDIVTIPQASLREVRGFIEREELYGRGIGLIDICLLASVRITPGAQLWTFDKRLAAIARQFSIAFIP
jgi:predicted nucleic acid-binding protein